MKFKCIMQVGREDVVFTVYERENMIHLLMDSDIESNCLSTVTEIVLSRKDARLLASSLCAYFRDEDAEAAFRMRVGVFA